MSDRFPRYAENLVKTLCSQYGVTCHEVEEDRTGWDLHVEFPAGDQQGPPDTHAGFWQTYIQIKSTRSKDPKCRIKLSNMLYAAQSVNPWFIILIQNDPTDKSEKIYIKHIWEELIKVTLEKTRKAYEHDKQLHQVEMSLRFGRDDRHDKDAISEIHKYIKNIGEQYHAQKAHIFNTIGYEEGAMQGIVKLQPKNKDELLDNFLGLGSGLPLTHFTGYPQRFGIVSITPEIEVESGTIKITPSPVTQAEVRLIGRQSGESISQEADVYSTPFPAAKASDQRIRFSTVFLDIIYGLDGTGRIDVKWDAHSETSLLTLWQFCKFNKLVSTENVDAEIWFENRKVMGADIGLNDTVYDLNWASLDHLSSLFVSCCSYKDSAHIRISLEDILESAQYCMIFSTVCGRSAMMLQLEDAEQSGGENNELDKVGCALYFTYTIVRRYVFCKIIKRPINSNSSSGNIRRIEMGVPVTVRSYVLSADDANWLDTLRQDYQRAVDNEEATGTNALEIRDILNLVNTQKDL